MTGCRGRGALTSSSIDQLQEEVSKYGESITAENTKVRNKEFVAWKFREHVIDSCDLFTLYVLWRRQLFYPARARSARARRARALRALGLLLADGALTVGWGKTFWGIGRVPSRKRA